MTTLIEASIDTLESLVNQNKNAAGETGCTDVCCKGVRCRMCPMSERGGVSATIGDVRMELYKRKDEPTESHKGGGGWSRPADLYITGNSEPMQFIPTCSPTVDEAVYSPKHYAVLDDIEAIQIIARSMTVEQFKGYCLGNIMKYRLRLGAKDAVEQDLKKATNYKDIFEKFKELCHDYRAGS